MRQSETGSNNIQQHDAHELASGYTAKVRAVEVASTLGFIGGQVWLAYRLFDSLLQAAADGSGFEFSAIWIVALVMMAYILADFVSGFFHWMGDTWGSPETPLAGAVFVRPFREHHVDQLAITRHDFIEVNGANCAISIPVLAALHFLPFETTRWGAPVGVFFSAFLWFIFATNQFHMWAHIAADKRPRVVSLLQRLHLILPPDHHAIHHAAPYSKYYSITVGWVNEPLHRLRFYRVLEFIISKLTGMVPRKDDIGLYAAKALAPTSMQDAGVVLPEVSLPSVPSAEPKPRNGL